MKVQKWMNIRPLFVWALSYMAGIAAALWLYMPVWMFIGAAGLLLVLYQATGRRRATGLACLLFVCLGILLGGRALPTPTTYAGDVTLAGTVHSVELDKRTGEQNIILTNASADLEDVDGHVSLTVPASIYAVPGDVLLCRSTLAFNPYDEGYYPSYLQAKGIFYTATPQVDTLLVQPVSYSLRYTPKRIAQHIRNSITQLYGEQAPLIIGMLLGDTYGLDASTKSAFRTSGTAHILAVSGLHIGFVALVVGWLVRKLRPRLRFGITVGCIWLYCLVVGLPASAVRACVMSTCALLGSLIGEKRDMLSSMSAAALIILLVSPLQLFSVGFQLSFTAVLGIAMFARLFAHALQALPQFLRSSLSVSAAAQLGITPISLAVFGNLQPYALVANLFIVPLASVVTIGGLLSAFLYTILPVVALPVAWVIRGVCMFMHSFAHLISQLPFALLQLGNLPMPTALSSLVLLFLLSPFYLRRGAQRLPAVIVAAGVVVASFVFFS